MEMGGGIGGEAVLGGRRDCITQIFKVTLAGKEGSEPLKICTAVIVWYKGRGVMYSVLGVIQ